MTAEAAIATPMMTKIFTIIFEFSAFRLVAVRRWIWTKSKLLWLLFLFRVTWMIFFNAWRKLSLTMSLFFYVCCTYRGTLYAYRWLSCAFVVENSAAILIIHSFVEEKQIVFLKLFWFQDFCFDVSNEVSYKLLLITRSRAQLLAEISEQMNNAHWLLMRSDSDNVML